MSQLIKMSLYFLAFTATVSCSTTGNNHPNHPRRIGSTQQLPLNNKAGVLVFRTQNDAGINQTTVNVYIDGNYLTSLQRGEYRYADLCPGRHYIEFAYANQDPAYLKKLNKSQTFELRNGEVFYTEVIGDGFGGVNMRPSTKGSVDSQLPNLRLQQRTISRVISGNDC